MIRPGFYGQTRIALEQREHALALPSTAVRIGDGGAYVLALEGDTVRRRNVAIGLVDAQWTEITSGLDEGARVVADGSTSSLTDGAQVRALAP
jgi:multidrug efflux pump subunit AcrA (membrane-fusion protein)